jgi:hypothetical protein
MSGQSLLSVQNWDAIVSSLPKQPAPTTSTPAKKSSSPLPNLRDLLLLPHPPKQAEGSSSAPTKSDYPITTERAGIVSRFVEDVIFGEGVAWDLGVSNEEGKGKGKKKGKK